MSQHDLGRPKSAPPLSRMFLFFYFPHSKTPSRCHAFWERFYVRKKPTKTHGPCVLVSSTLFLFEPREFLSAMNRCRGSKAEVSTMPQPAFSATQPAAFVERLETPRNTKASTKKNNKTMIKQPKTYQNITKTYQNSMIRLWLYPLSTSILSELFGSFLAPPTGAGLCRCTRAYAGRTRLERLCQSFGADSKG